MYLSIFIVFFINSETPVLLSPLRLSIAPPEPSACGRRERSAECDGDRREGFAGCARKK